MNSIFLENSSSYYFVLEQPEKIQQEELVMESKDSLESDSHSKSLQERIEIIKVCPLLFSSNI